VASRVATSQIVSRRARKYGDEALPPIRSAPGVRLRRAQQNVKAVIDVEYWRAAELDR
jgi:hypothetical protein